MPKELKKVCEKTFFLANPKNAFRESFVDSSEKLLTKTFY